MSSRSMSLDVLVRLRDRLTGPLRTLKNQLKSIVDFGRKLGLLGVAIAAISFMGPIKEAAAFQQKLLDIAGTIELTGKKAFDFTDQARVKFEALALASGQFSDTIADGYGKMTAAGLDRGLIDASIGDIARAATAAHAEFSDMSDVATSLMQTLKVPADQLNDSLGALVVAGKLGSFELKDMAKYFPSLTSQMAKFGVTGREAVNYLGAALQIARKGTSDPAEAANNLKNFLSKILTPATIKNFKDAGVDIQAVMKDAATKGINPIEAVMQKIVKLTGTSGKEIATMMKKAQDQGLSGADALAQVREQLEKIHGAGALSEIFADQQVMDFLIPFLANVEEFRRIKDQVAKATGGVIDADFETQMKGLNEQLETFQEIGTQASREVGFAFGSWLPWLNENLAAALKWYREWNKESGGLGTKLLTMAGGGVLAALAIGALGIALPAIAAGFAALGALLSPVGIALAAVAAGAVYLYRNWGTYGPRVMRIWQGAKRGFQDFADGAVRIGKRLWQAGKDIYAAFGPRITAGLKSAWASLKFGWDNVKGFFDAIAKAAGMKIDFSWLTIDNAQVFAFQAIETALKGISAAWQALKDFGSGFALHLPDIGEDIGKTIKAFGDIGTSLGRIGSAIGKLIGLDMVKFNGFFKTLGEWAGKATGWAFDSIRVLAESLAKILKTIADLAEGDYKIEWKNILPDEVVSGWKSLAAAINTVREAMEWLNKKTTLPDMPNPFKEEKPRPGEKEPRFKNYFLDRFLGPDEAPKNVAANSNFAAGRAAQRQTVDVSGVISIVVKGNADVSATSSNPKVKLSTSKTGRVVGGV